MWRDELKEQVCQGAQRLGPATIRHAILARLLPLLASHPHARVRFHGLLYVVQGCARLAPPQEVQPVGVMHEGFELLRFALVEDLPVFV